MAIGVALRLDRVAGARVSQIWKSLDEAGIENDVFQLGYAPHLTLAVWLDASTSEVAEVEALKEARSIPLQLEGIGRFEAERPAIWLRPSRSASLLAMQNVVARGSVSPGPLYLPDTWVPHVTLFQGPAEHMEAAAEVIKMHWTGSINATLCRLEVLRFPPVIVLDGFNLAGAKKEAPSEDGA
jgi:2'-5' RNA ligase